MTMNRPDTVADIKGSAIYTEVIKPGELLVVGRGEGKAFSNIFGHQSRKTSREHFVVKVDDESIIVQDTSLNGTRVTFAP